MKGYMYLEESVSGNVYRERIPKAIRVIVTVLHVLAILPLLTGLILFIVLGVSEPMWLRSSIYTIIAFIVSSIVCYFVASGTLDAGFNREKNGALIATPFLLWVSVMFSGLTFLAYSGYAPMCFIASVGGGLMLIESLFLFVAIGCATERKTAYLREKRRLTKLKQPKDYIPTPMKAATITFFALSLAVIIATMIIAFLRERANILITIYEKKPSSYFYYSNYYYYRVDSASVGISDLFWGIASLAALITVLASMITYCVGSKRNNKTLAITFLPIVAAQVIMSCFGILLNKAPYYGSTGYTHLSGNYYYELSITRADPTGAILGIVSAALLAITFMFVFISWCIAHREQKLYGNRSVIKQTTVIRGFDYNKQNWWD